MGLCFFHNVIHGCLLLTTRQFSCLHVFFSSVQRGRKSGIAGKPWITPEEKKPPSRPGTMDIQFPGNCRQSPALKPPGINPCKPGQTWKTPRPPGAKRFPQIAAEIFSLQKNGVSYAADYRIIILQNPGTTYKKSSPPSWTILVITQGLIENFYAGAGGVIEIFLEGSRVGEIPPVPGIRPVMTGRGFFFSLVLCHPPFSRAIPRFRQPFRSHYWQCP